MHSSVQNGPRVGVLDVLDEGGVVLADVPLLVVARDVVPLDPVPVEVVQHRQAGLFVLALEVKEGLNFLSKHRSGPEK